MQRIHNPEMERLILNHLADLYKIKDRREGIHLSDLIYCLTRSFFNQKQMIEPTDEEVMLFALGFGLQDVLTPKESTTPVYEKDGITYSPDLVLSVDSKTCEIKTTRRSSKRDDLPDTWIEYIMGGCYIRGINTYELIILYMMGNYAPPFPQMYAETLVFDSWELENNWHEIITRKVVFDMALETNKPPAPTIWCKEWECKNCRYSMQCSAIKMLEGFDDTKTDPQELKHE